MHRRIIASAGAGLCRQAFATLGAAGGQDLTAVFGRHAGAEAVVTLALEIARLECPFHGVIPKWNSWIKEGADDSPGRPGCQLARSPWGLGCKYLYVFKYFLVAVVVIGGGHFCGKVKFRSLNQ